MAVQDGLLYRSVDQRFTVQFNDEVPADVGSSHITEDFGTFGSELKGDLMTLFTVGVGSGFHHITGHEHVAAGVLELHLGGGADQVEYGVILHVRNFNTDSIGAQPLNIGFIKALVAQTGADDGHRAFTQAVKVRGGAFRSFAGIFHIHTAPQVKTQRQGFRPVVGVGGGQPGQYLVQTPRRQAHPGDTNHAKCDGDDEQHTQRDDGSGFAANALIAGFHIDRFLLRKHS